jgi:hypothetical protein
MHYDAMPGRPGTPCKTVSVPADNVSIWDVMEFALSYDGYGRLGGFKAISDLGNKALHDWEATGELPTELESLRACLLFEQRRWRHFDEEPTGDAQTYIRALVEAIRAASGGEVADDRPFTL